jgi:glycine/D-amino acid oxidase-like deaminating enzyme
VRILVQGGGIFGVAAARELRARGHEVVLADPGPLPHPEAESTDISKVVRVDYGADEALCAWMEDGLRGWRAWNAAWGEPLFHEVGVAFLSRGPLEPGGFEFESKRVLGRRGHRVERASHRDFPVLRGLEDGYRHGLGGWAESGRVVGRLLGELRGGGVEVREGAVDLVGFDHRVVAAGAWTPLLLPELAAELHATAQPVFHLRPRDPGPFRGLPAFGADISRTGWYGFPWHADAGVVKLANHGPGRRVDPRAPRAVTTADIAALRAFCGAHIPSLLDAELVYTRACVYGDSHDGQFVIRRLSPVLTVAAGGSGHAFKFAPLLGPLIADVVEGRPHPLAGRFGERPVGGGAEGARAR